MLHDVRAHVFVLIEDFIQWLRRYQFDMGVQTQGVRSIMLTVALFGLLKHSEAWVKCIREARAHVVGSNVLYTVRSFS